MLETNTIYNMECTQGMKMLPDCCIDLTVTSPPYDNLRTYKGFEWDFEETAKQLYRITKHGGVVVWVVGDATIKGSETGTSFRQALYFKDIGFNLHDTMIYHKINPTPQQSNRYQPCFEYMFVFSKGKPTTFNPIMVEKTRMENSKAKMYNKAQDGRQIVRPYTATSTKKHKKNIWEYAVGLHNTTSYKDAFKHPAVFPEQLVKDHILSWSNPGDIVLDPFIGSGTTGVVCVETDREYIGFEISSEYFNLATKRIASVTEQPKQIQLEV